MGGNQSNFDFKFESRGISSGFDRAGGFDGFDSDRFEGTNPRRSLDEIRQTAAASREESERMVALQLLPGLQIDIDQRVNSLHSQIIRKVGQTVSEIDPNFNAEEFYGRHGVSPPRGETQQDAATADSGGGSDGSAGGTDGRSNGGIDSSSLNGGSYGTGGIDSSALNGGSNSGESDTPTDGRAGVPTGEEMDAVSLDDDPTQPSPEFPDNRSGLPSMGEAIDRWDPYIIAAAEREGVPAAQLKAMVYIETGGTGDPGSVQINPTYGNTYGLTQINTGIWGAEAARLGYDLSTVEGQLGMGAYILRQGYEIRGDWDGASRWYFNPSETGDSVNGTTNDQYIARMHELMGY